MGSHSIISQSAAVAELFAIKLILIAERSWGCRGTHGHKKIAPARKRTKEFHTYGKRQECYRHQDREEPRPRQGRPALTDQRSPSRPGIRRWGWRPICLWYRSSQGAHGFWQDWYRRLLRSSPPRKFSR